MEIEFFAGNELVAQIEADLAQATGLARLKLLVALSWHLRQRDTHRALALVAEVERCLADSAIESAIDSGFDSGIDYDFAIDSNGLTIQARQTIALRMKLIRAEAKWLFGELDESTRLAHHVLQGFTALSDACGCADTHWLCTWLAFDQGDLALSNVEVAAMTAIVANADPVRAAVGQAALARFALLSNVSTREYWSAYFNDTMTVAGAPHDPAAACWVEDFFGLAASLSSDYVESIRHWSKTYALALASGQYRRALIVAVILGYAFNSLNEYHTALEWMQRALDLARNSGWQGMVGVALKQTAETLRLLQRYDAAYSMLREALDLMAPIAASRYYAAALQYLGELELDRKNWDSALESFRMLEQRARALRQEDLVTRALRGQAEALLQLEQPRLALDAAQAALDAANLNADDQIAALRVMAGIHARHLLPVPDNIAAASTSLHYLLQAFNLANTIADFIMPDDLLDALADEYARVADHQQAFHYARQANMARQKIQSREATNRAHAMQVSYQIEQARSDAEHHRQLALSEARRAQVLQENGEILAKAHKELAAAHRQLQETQQQLVLQGKMAGLGTLTAGVAHEINNPTNFAHVAAQNLQVDLHAFQLFLNDLADGDEAPRVLELFEQRFKILLEHVGIILNGTQRIKGIVKDLRSFTRLDEAEKKPVRLSDCLRSTLNLVRASWQERVEFITNLDPDPEIECWPALLNQVFMNLLVNACQAIQEKQQSRGNMERGKLWLGLHIDQARRSITVSFEDNGVGIDVATQARILEPFYTTKEVGVGTGLGLSISFGIVQKHGGKLDFHSTPGVGSCFSICLPLAGPTGALANEH
jgi:signal transduction histidine kinase